MSQRQVIEQRIAELEQEVAELARRVYDNELTWARMTPSWRLRLEEWRYRHRRGIPTRGEFVAWAAIRTALRERGVRLPDVEVPNVGHLPSEVRGRPARWSQRGRTRRSRPNKEGAGG